MASKNGSKNLSVKKYGSLAGVVLVVAIIVGIFIPQTIYRFYVHHAGLAVQQSDYDTADELVNLAEDWSTWSLSGWPNDVARLETVRGDIYLGRAENTKVLKEMGSLLDSAAHAYQLAIARAPYNIEAYTGLARTVDTLNRLHPFLYNKPYPINPLSTYNRLMKLMPVNLYTHSLLTRYFESRKKTEELESLVEHSISIYPPLYFQLKRQSFYSRTMNERLKKALYQAISENVYREEALRALSDIAFIEGDFAEAVAKYREAIPADSYRDHSGYYLHLGRLELRAGLLQEAEQTFITAIEERKSDNQLEKIYNLYRQEKYFHEFMKLTQLLEDRFELSQFIDILGARCLMELQQYSLATSRLITIKSPQYLAEASYLLAKIAEAKEDWDTMELKSQRATVLDVANYRYHLLFSRSLQRQKKYLQAELAATKAIEVAENENPWLYNHRAWLRWSLQKYDEAGADWEKAIRISPDNSEFFYNVALVYEKGGNATSAVNYLKKALAIKPGTVKYQKKLAQLQQN